MIYEISDETTLESFKSTLNDAFKSGIKNSHKCGLATFLCEIWYCAMPLRCVILQLFSLPITLLRMISIWRIPYTWNGNENRRTFLVDVFIHSLCGTGMCSLWILPLCAQIGLNVDNLKESSMSGLEAMVKCCGDHLMSLLSLDLRDRLFHDNKIEQIFYLNLLKIDDALK